MDPNTASNDVASQLEEGRSPISPTISDFDDIKKNLPTPNTVTTFGGDTITELRESYPRQALRRIQTWPRAARKVLVVPKRGPKAKVIIKKLEDSPVGYPKVSTFLDSDECFMIYRRFGSLHARLLLTKQDEIREMEEELADMDAEDDLEESTKRCLTSRARDFRRRPQEDQETRKQLLARIEKKVLEYGQLLIQARELVAMNKPAERDRTSLANFLQNAPRNLVEDEEQFVFMKEDLVSIRGGRENSWLDSTIERALRTFYCRPIKWIFCSKESRMKSDDENNHYFDRSRINGLVTLIITLVILFLLVIPIAALYYLTVNKNSKISSYDSIGVLLVSTLLCSTVLSLFTRAKRHEILAAAAGYCAVLVVFVGNVGGSGDNGGLTR